MRVPPGVNLMRICLCVPYFPPVIGEAEGRRPFRGAWCLNAEDARWLLNLLAAHFLWER